MGKISRAYRYHPDHQAVFGKDGIPQDIVAGWLGISQPQVSRAENGAPIRNLDALILWAQALRIPQRHLWFTLPTGSTGASRQIADEQGSDDSRIASTAERLMSVRQVAYWAEVSTVELAQRLTRKDLALNRREVAKSLAGIALGIPLLDVLDRWVVDEDDRRPDIPGDLTVGDQEIAHLEYTAKIFRDWDDRIGGGLRRKAVVGQLNEVAALLRESHPEKTRQGLLSVVAHLAETAATMSWDSGLQGLAQRYYVTAFRAARAANDWQFSANILAGMARQLLYLGHPSDALELVRLAQKVTARHPTPALSSMLCTREAWAYAAIGRVTAFRRTAGEAEEYLASSNPDAEPEWLSYFDGAELAGTVGGRFLELTRKDRRQAQYAADSIGVAITRRRAGRLRSAALDQIGLAEARLLQGEHDEAAKLGEEALYAVAQTPSDRVRVMLIELYRNSIDYGSVPAIAGLRDNIRGVLDRTKGGKV